MLNKIIEDTMKMIFFILLLVVFMSFSLNVVAAPVPDTGQAECYSVNGNVTICPSPGQALYGQDANNTINPMSYTKLDANGNALPDSASSWGMVKDNVTGLIWEMKTNKDGKADYSNFHDADNTYSWYDSENFIKSLNNARYGGFSDWRLPTVKELTYIINYNISYPGPTINTDYFPNTASSFYWSSTTSAYVMKNAWGVSFYLGSDSSGYKSSSYYVRAVRGEQSGLLGNLVIGSFDTWGSESIGDTAAAGSYTDNGNGTVTDTSTGLMWRQAGSSNTMTWEQALAYCEDMDFAGYTDWRLPTIKELRSLVDYSQYDPAINATYFPSTASSFYWSSTTFANYTYYAWGVPFNYGHDYYSYKKHSHYARAVRGGQSGLFGNLVISPVSR
jgi:hypothetical protein